MPDTKVRAVLAQLPADETPFQVLLPEEVIAGRVCTGCRVISSYAVELDAQENELQWSWGISDFLTTVTVNIRDQNAITGSDCNTFHQVDNILHMRSPGGSSTARTATITPVVGGVEITCNQSGLQHQIEVTLVFGSACFVFNQPGVGGSNTFDIIHGFATAPGAGFYAVCHPFSAQTVSVRVGYGFHADNGAGIIAKALGFRHDNNVNPSNQGQRIFEDKVAGIAAANGAALDRIELTVNAPGTNTYLEVSGVNGATMGLLIECDDIETALVVEQSPTNETLDWVVDSIGFRPQFVTGILSQRIDDDSGGSDITSGTHGFLSMDADGDIHSVLGIARHNTATMRTRSAVFQKLAFLDHTGDLTQDIGPNFVFNDLGFVFPAAGITITDPIARTYPLLVFEESEAPPESPVLTDPTDTPVSATTALGTVTVSIPTGSLFAVVTQSAVTPTHLQIVAGEDHLGAPADYAAEEFADTGIEGNNINEFAPFTGLVDAVQYFTHYTQIEADLDIAVPVSADGFILPGTNVPPVVDTPIPAQVCTVGIPFGPLDVSGNFSDPNGDPLVFSQQGLPVGLTISTPGIISGTPRGGFQPINPSHIMNTGSAGVRVGFIRSTFGALNPDTFNDEDINSIITIEDSDELVISVLTEFVAEEWWDNVVFFGDFGAGNELVVWDRVADGFLYEPNPGGDLTSWRAPIPSGTKLFLDSEEYQTVMLK